VHPTQSRLLLATWLEQRRIVSAVGDEYSLGDGKSTSSCNSHNNLVDGDDDAFRTFRAALYRIVVNPIARRLSRDAGMQSPEPSRELHDAIL
jgi:hypothetical protein